MERLKCLAMSGLIVLFLVTGLAAGGPNEPGKERKKQYAPVEFIDDGGWLPTPGASSAGRSALEESLFATYSFSDKGTVYNIEFYYRALYSTLRVRVLVGNRELHGLFNRFYGFPSGGRSMFFVTRDDDGSPMISMNFGQLVLKESAIDMDAIYDALDGFLSKSDVSRAYASVYMDPPPRLLGKTCRARIMGDPVVDYLISEDGHVEPLTLESLRVAYNKEGVKAKNADDYKEIAWSLIVAEHKSASRYEIALISSVNDIPGYSSHKLDLEKEAEVKAPEVRFEAETHIDYWTCHTYSQYHGVVARYTFGFHEGQLQSAERLVLGEGIGNASYLGDELPHASRGSGSIPAPGNDARPRRSPFETFGAVFAGVGVLLLLCAFLVRRHSHASLERQRQESQ